MKLASLERRHTLASGLNRESHIRLASLVRKLKIVTSGTLAKAHEFPIINSTSFSYLVLSNHAASVFVFLFFPCSTPFPLVLLTAAIGSDTTDEAARRSVRQGMSLLRH